MMKNETGDVMIAGGGFVGMTLALALEAQGFEPVLLDKTNPEEQTGDEVDGRAFALSPASLRLYDRLGVGEKLRPSCQPIKHIITSDGYAKDGIHPKNSGLFSLHFSVPEKKENSTEALGFMVEAQTLRKILVKTVLRSGIRFLAPVRMVGMESGPSHRQIDLEDGRTVRAPALLAADGRSSWVRRQAGLPIQAWSYRQRAFVTTLSHEYDHKGTAYEHCLSSGTFALLPLQGRRSSLVWVERQDAASALDALEEDVFAEELRRRMGDILGDVEISAPLWHYPLGFQIAKRTTAPRLALVGDAAHSVHPLAGQGFNLGLRDVDVLANILTEARRLGEDYGSLMVLRRYEKERRLHNLVMGLSLDMFNRLFSNNSKILRAARRTGLGFVNRSKPLRDFFQRTASGSVL